MPAGAPRSPMPRGIADRPGRRHDGEGPHRIAHRQPRLAPQAGRDGADPRGGERRRPDPGAVGEATWAPAVIGTVGSHEKAQVAARPRLPPHRPLPRDRLRGGRAQRSRRRACHAVLDGVGRDTFMASLDCLRPFGIAVNYGNASGHVPPLDLLDLCQEGQPLRVAAGLRATTSRSPARCTPRRPSCSPSWPRGTLRIEIARTYPLQRRSRRPTATVESRDPRRVRWCSCREGCWVVGFAPN